MSASAVSLLSWIHPLQRARARRAPASSVVKDEDIEAHLQMLCTPPLSRSTGKSTDQISYRNIQNLQTLLALMDAKAEREVSVHWSQTPRTYGILRSIGGLEFMDEFRAKNFNDFYLPYNERTLPDFLQAKDGRDLRQAFLDAQNYFLTNAKRIETEGTWTHFDSENGDNIFQSIRTLGQGSFGGVDLVYSRLSLKYYARKRVLRGRDSERSREAQRTLIRELGHLKQISHRHLVKIIASYTDLEYISYIMEPVADLDLERFLTLQPADFSPDYQAGLRRFFGCLAGAVNYLHQSKIRHRDITARNILIHRDEVYISDFGSAYNWSNRTVSATRHHFTPVSPDYQAPEIAKREERDSKSDMFSLGVVFLEMTTRLLGRSTAELKRAISANARKHNSDQPYAYANLPVVLTWLDELMKGNTVEHDNEPLVWVRDLLQEKPQNRPSAKGLMKDILVSPSFRTFCCFKCQGDFEERAFEYDAGLQYDGLEDSTATKNTVANMFGEGASSSANGMSLQKNESVEQWLSVTRLDGGDEIPKPGAFPEIQDAPIGGEGSIEETSSLLSSTHVRNWYLTSDLHEVDRWYKQSILANDPDEYTTESYRSVQSPAAHSGFPDADPAVSGREGNLRDTGLGFMEYGSSDSDEGAGHKMFEEYSDSSDTSSDSESASPTKMTSGTHSGIKELGIIMEVDEIQSEEGVSGQEDNNAYQFDEVSDDSTTDETTQKLSANLRGNNSEPMSNLMIFTDSMAQAGSDVAAPNVAGYPDSPRAELNSGESATQGPKAVTCEEDPEIAMSDAHQIPSQSILDLGGSTLLEWPAEQGIEQQGTSASDESYHTRKQLETISEKLAESVGRSDEIEDGIASPLSMITQAMPSESQIEYGNALILSNEHTLDLSENAGSSDAHWCYTSKASESGDTERVVSFALPAPSISHASDSSLILSEVAAGEISPGSISLPMSEEIEDTSSSFIIANQPQQLEQAPATEPKLRQPLLDGVHTRRVIKMPKRPSARLNRETLAEKVLKGSPEETDLIASGSKPPAGQEDSQEAVLIPADQLTHVFGNSDANKGAQTQAESATFFETISETQKARKAPLPKTYLRPLDTGNVTNKTQSGEPILPSSIPRLPLTAANIKALRDAGPRPSPTRNKSSTQLQMSAEDTTPPPLNPPDETETQQDPDIVRSATPRSPRQRTALPAINAKSLMKTAWDSASASAPTSVMSDATKARFSRILVPFDQFDRMHNLLKDYCKQGKASAVKFLLQKGCNPGTKKHPRRGPLLAAIQGASDRHNKCVRELIKNDVDVNVKSKKSGKSALHLALENDQFQGYVRLIWLLVHAGAETNMPDANGDFPLTKVFFGAGSLPLEKHRLEALAVLLQGGAEPNLRASGTGNTPLHLAVRRQDKWAVAMLLHKGAAVNAKNSSGATPLQMTANQFRGDLSHDHAQVLDLLLQAKALIDERAGALSRTALHLAVTSGTAHAVNLLLDHGADPLLADKDGNTAIMLAIKGAAKMTADPDKIEDHVEVMLRLVKMLGPSWAPATNLQGICAVEAACSGDNMDLLRVLFVEGDLNPRSKFRDGTVLDFAKANGKPQVMEMCELYMD